MTIKDRLLRCLHFTIALLMVAFVVVSIGPIFVVSAVVGFLWSIVAAGFAYGDSSCSEIITRSGPFVIQSERSNSGVKIHDEG